MRRHRGVKGSILAGLALTLLGAAGKTPDFGVLGDPQAGRDGWIAGDPDFDRQSPEEKLALFRHHEQHPRVGAPDAPVPWSQVQQDEALQRALYYSVLAEKPHLIGRQDRKWLQRDEAFLIRASCDNRGRPGTLFDVPQKSCPKD